MPNINHRIGIDQVDIAEVYRTLSTVDGLSFWWTTHVKGVSKVGKRLIFYFGEYGVVFEVLELNPMKKVTWKCVEGPLEWIDTHIEFDLSEIDDGEVILLFKHGGWREEVEFMAHCSAQWAYFLFGLKNGLESSNMYTPFGGENFTSISSWTKA